LWLAQSSSPCPAVKPNRVRTQAMSKAMNMRIV
jgi:hypothetical protein